MADRSQTEALFGKTLHPDGTLRAVSPSQIITFKRCGLRWHFDKKGRLAKKPMGKGAAIGDAAHGRTEIFLKTGQDVRGPLELIGAEMLEPYLWAMPFNGGPAIVEGALTDPRLQTPGGVLITGYLDLYVPGEESLDNPCETSWSLPTIIDHKFKKDLDKWGYDTETVQDPERALRDREKLADDPQTIVYGAWALAKQPEAPGVIMRHHQVQTEGLGGRFGRPAQVRLTRDDLLRRWGALAEIIDGPMSAAARVPAALPGETPEGVPYNDLACSDFGGCDFARTCRHSPMNKFTALLKDSNNVTGNSSPSYKGTNPVGLLSQITTPASTPQTAPAVVAKSTPQTAPAMVTALAASVQATGGIPEIPLTQAKTGSVYLIPPTSSPARFEAMLGGRGIFRAKDGGLREVDAAASVKIPDEETVCMFEGKPFKKAEPMPIEKMPAGPSAEKITKARKLGIVFEDEKTDMSVAPPDVSSSPTVPPVPPAGALSNANVVTGAPVVVVKTEEAITTPAKRGRPKASTTTNSEGKTFTATSVPVASAAPLDVGTTEALAGKTDTKPFFLLINCACNRASDLAPYVAKLAADVAQRFGAPDVRLGHKQTDLGFGGWKALLALEATKNPPQGLCSIMSGELADPVIEALVPLAAFVVRGGIR